jgi:hypothetical protein
MATIQTGNPTPDSPPAVPARPHRPRGHLWLKILGAVVILGLLVFFLTPVILSMDWMRERIVRGLDEALDSPVSLEEYSLGWFSGVEVGKLRIGNPRTFPKQGDLLRLERASFDMSLFSLFGGEPVVRAKADGLEIRLHQLEDGRTNMDALTGSNGTWRVNSNTNSNSNSYSHTYSDSDSNSRRHRLRDKTRDQPRDQTHANDTVLANLDLDFALTNALIEVTDEKLGVLESMRNLNASIRKQKGALDIVCKLDVDLHHPDTPTTPGKLSARADMDIRRSRPWTFHFETTGLDLARYRPLLDWAVANPFEELGGVLAGKADATMQPDGSTTMTGKLVLARPRLKTLGERCIDLRGDAFVLEPNATFHLGGTEPDKLDLDGFRVDLGFLQVTGIPAAESAGLADGKDTLGLRFTLDLAGLASLGGAIPQELRSAQGTVNGRLLAVPSDNKVLLTTTQGTTLNGGPLRVTANAILDEKQHLPLDLEVAWQDGKVRGGAVRLLRYAVPLLAGLDVTSKLDFESDIDTTIQLVGPLLRQDNEATLQWLNHWHGTGKLKLMNGGFTPARQLGELLTFAGERNRLTFKDIDTDFVIKEGAVETNLLKMSRKAQTFGFRGKVYMDGRIDQQIALQDALAGHRDGEKIRRYLGDTALEAKLTGTLDKPKLAMPSLEKVLEAGASKKVDDALKKGFDKLLRRGKKDKRQQ